MCKYMDGMIFHTKGRNKFKRPIGKTAKDLTIQELDIIGLVPGINLPPINEHFHWCHSTLSYQIDKPIVELRENIFQNQNLPYKDITQEWLNKATPNSHIVQDRNYFEYKNIKYTVDNKNVVLDYSNKEKEIAEWLERTFGGEIFMLPRINNPKGIETPDYIFRKEYWDLKEVTGNGKHTLDSAIKKKKNQAQNFIFDISSSEMNMSEAKNQISKIMSSKDRQWVKKIIIKKDEIVKVHKKRD